MGHLEKALIVLSLGCGLPARALAWSDAAMENQFQLSGSVECERDSLERLQKAVLNTQYANEDGGGNVNPYRRVYHGLYYQWYEEYEKAHREEMHKKLARFNSPEFQKRFLENQNLLTVGFRFVVRHSEWLDVYREHGGAIDPKRSRVHCRPEVGAELEIIQKEGNLVKAHVVSLPHPASGGLCAQIEVVGTEQEMFSLFDPEECQDSH